MLIKILQRLLAGVFLIVTGLVLYLEFPESGWSGVIPLEVLSELMLIVLAFIGIWVIIKK